MIFYYAGIGFAMLTTVVAVFETSTTINKKQFINKTIAVDEEKIILQKQNDKVFLQMLNDIKGKSLGVGQEICQNIKNGFTDSSNPNSYILVNYASLNNYDIGIPSYSDHVRLKNGCQFIKDSHRVIIVPYTDELNSYKLYSCLIDIEPKCDFELY